MTAAFYFALGCVSTLVLVFLAAVVGAWLLANLICTHIERGRE